LVEDVYFRLHGDVYFGVLLIIKILMIVIFWIVYCNPENL
jgi:hypothetical protein